MTAARSSQEPATWVRGALRAFGVAALRCEELRSSENLVFRVTSARGEEYCLRTCSPDSVYEEELLSELIVLEALVRGSYLKVPEPVRSTDGELLVRTATPEAAGYRTCALFRWVEGREADEALAAPLAQAIGMAIGYLHVFSRTFRPPAAFCRPSYDSAWVPTLTSWLDGDPRAGDFGPHRRQVLEQAVGKVAAAMDVLGEDPRYFGLVHSDLHFGNLIVQGARVQVIDFEWCGWGHYLYDLASTLRSLRERPDLRERLLEGYTRVCPLPQTHPGQMDCFLAAHELVLLEWLFTTRSPDRRRRRARSVRRVFDHLERFVVGRPLLAG